MHAAVATMHATAVPVRLQSPGAPSADTIILQFGAVQTILEISCTRKNMRSARAVGRNVARPTGNSSSTS